MYDRWPNSWSASFKGRSPHQIFVMRRGARSRGVVETVCFEPAKGRSPARLPRAPRHQCGSGPLKAIRLRYRFVARTLIAIGLRNVALGRMMNAASFQPAVSGSGSPLQEGNQSLTMPNWAVHPLLWPSGSRKRARSPRRAKMGKKERKPPGLKIGDPRMTVPRTPYLGARVRLLKQPSLLRGRKA